MYEIGKSLDDKRFNDAVKLSYYSSNGSFERDTLLYSILSLVGLSYKNDKEFKYKLGKMIDEPKFNLVQKSLIGIDLFCIDGEIIDDPLIDSYIEEIEKNLLYYDGDELVNLISIICHLNPK